MAMMIFRFMVVSKIGVRHTKAKYLHSILPLLWEPLKINFFILTDAETYLICTLRTLRNPLRTLRFNPNYFNRKGRKDSAKDAKNLFLEVPLCKR